MDILQLFDKYLGSHKTLKKNEYAYHCPFCHHHKQKLQLNDKSFKFHCWTCNAGGNLSYLAKKIGFSNTDLVDLDFFDTLPYLVVLGCEKDGNI